MNRFKALLKAEFRNLLATSNVTNIKFMRGNFGILALLIPIVLIAYIFVTYGYAIFMVFPYEIGYIGILMLLLMAFIVITYLSFYTAYGHLFGIKDFDFLMSLPVTEREIFLSKVLSFIALNYLYSLSAILPIFWTYAASYNVNPLPLFGHALFIWLGFPFIPVIIASVLSFLISLVGNRSRHKGIVKIVMSVLALVLLMAGIGGLNSLLIGEITNIQEIVNNFRSFVPNLYYPTEAIINNNYLQQLLILIVLIVVFTVFIFIFSKFFIRINRLLETGYKRQNYQFRQQRRSSLVIALFKREWTRYLGNVTYVINTGFGSVMSLVGVGYLLVNRDMVEYLLYYFGSSTLIPFICAAIFVLAGLIGTTSCSISLEGNRLWILKSLPIRENDIFASKILLSLLVNVPLTIVSIVIIQIFLKIPLIYLPLFIVLCVAVALFTALLGLIINLQFPKLDWEREVYVVKNSMSVFVATMVSMAIIMLVCFGGYFLLNTSWIMPYIYGVTVVLVLFDFLLYLILSKNGARKFRALI